MHPFRRYCRTLLLAIAFCGIAVFPARAQNTVTLSSRGKLLGGSYWESIEASYWQPRARGNVPVLARMLAKKAFMKEKFPSAVPFNALWALAHIRAALRAVLEHFGHARQIRWIAKRRDSRSRPRTATAQTQRCVCGHRGRTRSQTRRKGS
jgi:hypothetical protein